MPSTSCGESDCIVCHGESGDFRCNWSNVIYHVTCDEPDCSDDYIGQTGRTLKERFTEHSRTAANPTADSYQDKVWAQHAIDAHDGEPIQLSVEFLEVKRDEQQRRDLEKEYIEEYEPTLNTQHNRRRQEDTELEDDDTELEDDDSEFEDDDSEFEDDDSEFEDDDTGLEEMLNNTHIRD